MSSLGEILSATPWLFACCVFVLSLLVGSFLNVVIHRLPIMLDREWKAQAMDILAPAAVVAAGDASVRTAPAEERYNLLVPRSRCPRSEAPIEARHNVPLLSWLLLGGRCAHCRAPIAARYPVVELLTAVLSAAVALRFGWHWQTLAALAFTWA
ncbi:MAG: prepilin peptidase, partial [Steroidobacteraceae bacterium]